MLETLKNAQKAFLKNSLLDSELKNQSLINFAQLIEKNSEALLEANEKDLAEQKGKISEVLYQRLKLDDSKLQQIVEGIRSLTQLEDPCQKVIEKTLLDDDLVLEKVSVPIGVIGVIFESRPDVIPQVLSLVLKSGNAAVLKGGREALNTNKAFMNVVSQLNKELKDLDPHWAQLIESREDVQKMLEHSEYLDLVVPRGSNQFVQYVMEHSKAPVLGHADGICHVYIHEDANLEMALEITMDSKTNYPAACNALETLLVHQSIATRFLPELFKASQSAHVELRGCSATRAILSEINEAQENDWNTEYGDLILSVKLVEDLDDALEHIAQYSSKHTEVIVSQSQKIIEQFMRAVDSSSVFANASTRFADGFRFGLGAELGISTSKTHARGPVGLEGLCIYKYLLRGQGQIVADYSGPQKTKMFKHQKI